MKKALRQVLWSSNSYSGQVDECFGVGCHYVSRPCGSRRRDDQVVGTSRPSLLTNPCKKRSMGSRNIKVVGLD